VIPSHTAGEPAEEPAEESAAASRRQSAAEPTAAGESGPGFTIQEIEQLYEFPEGTSGRGQRIGIVALNRGRALDGKQLVGGYEKEGLERAFAGLGRRMPTISDVPVDSHKGRDRNAPGDGDPKHDVTAEVLLDLQVAGGLAPDAEYVVYFSESSEQGLTDAVWRAVTDRDNDLTVLLICYGSPEGAEDGALWTGMCLDELDRALAAAALRGITVVTSCGDNGGAGAPWSTRVHADFPAASPWVLSCGGTRVDRFTREQDQQQVRLESVWNDGRGASGGGISRLVPRPPWQSAADLPGSADWANYSGRGVPDVAALADPATGVYTYDAKGDRILSGGTSVSAPIWAALVARLAEAMGGAQGDGLGEGARLGLLAPALYELLGTDAFTDVMLGDNGPYRARRGWDPCTGLGTPRGTRLLSALR
jgi:kumamolisin